MARRPRGRGESSTSGAVNGSGSAIIATVPGGPGAPNVPVRVPHRHRRVGHAGGHAARRRPPGSSASTGDDPGGRQQGRRRSGHAGVRGGRQVPEARRPTVLAAFTCCEESGKMGAGLLPRRLLQRVDCAFSVDGAEPARNGDGRWARPRSSSSSTGAPPTPPPTPRRGSTPSPWPRRSSARSKLGRQPGGGSVNVAAMIGGSVIDRLTPGERSRTTGVPGRVGERAAPSSVP